MQDRFVIWLFGGLVRGLIGSLALVGSSAAAQVEKTSPSIRGSVELRVDDLVTPIGIDDPMPHLSWQLSDPAQGARQTAYQVMVASSMQLLSQGKADIWDSGRVESDASINVHYAGAALQPSTRYAWQVKLWGVDGQPYSASATSWWETGLMDQNSWRALWIGFETPEEDAVRHAPAAWITSPDAQALAAEKAGQQNIAYRRTITVSKPVKSASLYATGRDTVSAWVNGTQLLAASPFPPYKQMPWKKFVRADATGALRPGTNTIAIETVHYVTDPDDADPTPMIATLIVEYADGTREAFASGTDWKTAIHAANGWQQDSFDDTAWKHSVDWSLRNGPDHPGPLGHPWIPDSVKVLHHEFVVSIPVKSARLYATALGDYELFLNHSRVGDQILAPGWSDYREHVKYQTYDVTAQLAAGENTIEAQLAPGWYQTPLEWFQQPNNYGDTPPALKAQIRIEHTDGTVEWVTTSDTWQARPSYILHSELYDGEIQNEQADPGPWQPAAVIEPKAIAVEAQDFQPIRVERELMPKSVNEPKAGVFVYDFGQNFSGVERLRLKGPAGTRVQVRFAEILNSDGTIYTDNLRTAKVTDRFTLTGNGLKHNDDDEEEFTPQFTFHGFRYLEITGLTQAPPLSSVLGLVIHTDAPFTAKLETGSPLINQLSSNILWGQRSNFVGIPTDCPQRDERLGWMGDAEVFWRTATYNMDLASFSRKFGGDMRGTQVGSPYFGIYSPGTGSPNTGFAAGWSDAGVIIPWTSWLETGDTSIIEQNWTAMEKYLNAIEANNPDGLWVHESGIGFGDWLSPEGKTNYALIATAYWAYDATLMQQMAHATGRTRDEQKYAALFERIRTAFERKFVHEDGFVDGADNGASRFDAKTSNARNQAEDTQTGYVLALHMNLVPQSVRAQAAQKLADKIEANHGLLATGFLGTPYLLEELTKSGHAKLAYQLLMNTEYPSWGYLVDHGATTMWERWNGDQMKADPSMNSYNHYAYGAVADWIYRYAAGIDASTLDAGFHTIVLHPVFDARLGRVNFDYASSFGPIHSDWRVDGSTAEWHVTIPANSTGLLEVTSAEARKYKLSRIPLAESKSVKPVTHDGLIGYELPSGSYSFQVDIE
jgi:alpha-L-rhamnosidase